MAPARASSRTPKAAFTGQLYQEPQAAPVAVPMGKFAMYPDWQPDADFIRLAALWGVALREPVTTEELASFIAYWQASCRPSRF